MNWTEIKHIYRCVLINKNKFEYLGNNRYKLIEKYKGGEKRWEREYDGRYYKSTEWDEDGRIVYQSARQDGKIIKQIG